MDWREKDGDVWNPFPVQAAVKSNVLKAQHPQLYLCQGSSTVRKSSVCLSVLKQLHSWLDNYLGWWPGGLETHFEKGFQNGISSAVRAESMCWERVRTTVFLHGFPWKQIFVPKCSQSENIVKTSAMQWLFYRKYIWKKTKANAELFLFWEKWRHYWGTRI